MVSYAFTHNLTDGALTEAAAIRWAREAQAGDHLIDYDETGLEHWQDPGSRCGLSDPALDEVHRILRERGLRLEATDEGLVAEGLVAE